MKKTFKRVKQVRNGIFTTPIDNTSLLFRIDRIKDKMWKWLK